MHGLLAELSGAPGEPFWPCALRLVGLEELKGFCP